MRVRVYRAKTSDINGMSLFDGTGAGDKLLVEISIKGYSDQLIQNKGEKYEKK